VKIAMIGQKGIPGIFGGIDSHVDELSSRLARRGHEVVVYVRNWCTNRQLKVYQGVRLIHTLSVKTKHLDAFTHSLTSSANSLLGNFDIIHYHGTGPSFFCWIPRIIHKKIVVTIHSLPWKSDKWDSNAKLFLKLSEKVAVYVPDKIVVVSKTLQNYLASEYKKSATYIPSGISLPNFHAPDLISQKYNLKSENYIFFIGRLAPEKRVDWLIKAFKELKGKMPSLKLVIAGGSSATVDHVRGLKNLARDDKRIIFTGYVTGQEKEELFSNALLFVLPSYLEGLPIVLLEAMSYRLPCLVSDIPPHREVISEGVDGFLFQSYNFSDFVKKLGKLLQNSDRLRNVGENARRKVEKDYNWDEGVRKTEEVYKSLVD